MAERTTKAERTVEEIRSWQWRINGSREARTQWKEQYQVERLAATYNGDFDVLQSATEDSVVFRINRFWPTIRAMLPGMIARYPKFFVRPRGKQAKMAYRIPQQLEAILEDIVRQDDHFVQESKLALQQAFWGLGVLKVVYDPRMEPNPNAGEPMMLLGPDGLPMRGPDGQQIPMTDPETNAPMTQPRFILSDEVYRFEWIHWENMLLPHQGGPSMRRWQWVGEEITMPLDEAREDERFPRRLREMLKHTGRRNKDEKFQQWAMEQSIYQQHERDSEVQLIELWDIKNKRHLVIAEGQTFAEHEFLLDEMLPDGIEDHPYAILPGFTPKTDPEPGPWPIPYVWNWLPIQEEYTKRREQLMNGAKRSARKIFYDANTFENEDDAVAALQSSRDMEGVKLRDSNRPPITIPDPGSPPDVLTDLQAIEKDWRDVTGIPGERVAGGASPTATQAVLADRAATLRESELQASVGMWLAMAGRKMSRLIRGTLTLEKYVKIRSWSDTEVEEFVKNVFGPAIAQQAQYLPGLKEMAIRRFGREQWSPVTREDLNFDADVDIVPGSARARTIEQDRQQALLFLETVAKAPMLLRSRELVSKLADLFELGDQPLVDELVALGQQIAQEQAQQQTGAEGAGGEAPSPAQIQGGPQMVSRLQTALVNGGF